MSTPQARLARLFGREHAILVGRGRAALLALVEELGGEGLPVLLPSNICPAVLAAIVGSGARPILVPVSPQDGIAGDDRFAEVLRRAEGRSGIAMPAHLYGQWSAYPETARLAREKGWFLLENDSLATLAVGGGARAAVGDAVLVSFGSGKTIDAGQGGAILTDDAVLARALAQRAAGWPALAAEDEAVEHNLTLARRALRALGRADLSEPLLSLDLGRLRHGWAPDYLEALERALDRFEADCERRRERFEAWQHALRPFEGVLMVPSAAPAAPWRLVCRVADPRRRDAVATALREGGIDVGINFPPLTEGFPDLLRGQEHPDAVTWGRAVFNLWLSPAYDDSRIAAAAAILERSCAA